MPRLVGACRWLSASLAALALLVVPGCDSGGPTQPAPGTPLPEQCAVSRVVDGDTVDCADGSRIRLIGIDAPELDQVPFGDRSSRALGLLVEGRTVRLEDDVETRDDFGRRLAYLWLADLLVNESMVRDGWAVVFIIPPNTRYAERLRAAEGAARADGAGHWGTGGFDCLPADHRAGLC